MTKQKQMTERGFTLIELMIAVATTGVLAAIAIPQYQNYVAKSQVAEGLSLAPGAKTAVALYYMATENFPDDNEAARLATTITGKYVASVTVAGEKITAKFKSDINENIKDRSLVLTATDEDGAITFDCTTDLSEPYAPTGCKTDPNVGGPKAWDPKTSASEGKGACWSQEYADGAGGGNGWVEAKNDLNKAPPNTPYDWIRYLNADNGKLPYYVPKNGFPSFYMCTACSIFMCLDDDGRISKAPGYCYGLKQGAATWNCSV